MIDCPSTGVSEATRTAISRYAVGSVILDGTSTSGMQATRNVTNTLIPLAPRRIGLFIATDQEGGLVQRLQGPGFDRIPSAVQQGRLAPATLQSDARRWGDQLARAGVNVNLAPVLDTVPAGGGPNPPIGDLDRQYGSTPATVRSHGLAYAAGMAAAGVDVTVKHFPGLGRVSGNTDTARGVADTVTTANDPLPRTVPSGRPCRDALRDDVDRGLHPYRRRQPGGVLPPDRHRPAAGPARLRRASSSATISARPIRSATTAPAGGRCAS